MEVYLMNKKDRIAVVISTALLFFGLVFALANTAGLTLIIGLVLITYWGYRFIKNDISFIKIKE